MTCKCNFNLYQIRGISLFSSIYFQQRIHHQTNTFSPIRVFCVEMKMKIFPALITLFKEGTSFSHFVTGKRVFAMKWKNTDKISKITQLNYNCMGSTQTKCIWKRRKMQSPFLYELSIAKNGLEHEEYFACYAIVAQKFNRIISIQTIAN